MIPVLLLLKSKAINIYSDTVLFLFLFDIFRIQKIQSKTEILRPLENCAGIIRLPKGPDGTSGFNFRR